MTALRATAWSVFALDLAVLGTMIVELVTAEFGATGGVLATVLTETVGIWLLLVGVVLAAATRQRSRTGLWIGLVGGAVPLLWAWSMIVDALTEYLSGAS